MRPNNESDTPLEDSIKSQQSATQYASKEASKLAFEPKAGSNGSWKYVWHTEGQHLTIGRKNKTFASIMSPVFGKTLALSGYTDDHTHLPIISSSHYTNKSLKLAHNLQISLPDHEADFKNGEGFTGRYHVCHAEPKLIAFYVDFFTNHREGLDSLGSALKWDVYSLNINVSKPEGPCDFCQELARRIYEGYDIMINFVVEGQIFYPRCRTYHCQKEMQDGRRVYCSNCQSELDSRAQLAAAFLETADQLTKFTNWLKSLNGRL